MIKLQVSGKSSRKVVTASKKKKSERVAHIKDTQWTDSRQGRIDEPCRLMRLGWRDT